VPWFKEDDKFHSTRKLMGVPRRERMAAAGLWVIAGSWCMQELTDGRVPAFMLDEWGATPEAAGRLVDCGLWSVTDDGWLFNAWDEYQPTRDQVEEERAKARDRMARARANKADRSPDVQANFAGSSSGVRVTPSRPDPTPIPSSSSSDSRALPQGLWMKIADKKLKAAKTQPNDPTAWKRKVAANERREKRDRALELVEHYDLTTAQLVDVLVSDTNPPWLASLRRKDPA
jgi:hypothetical protein